MDAVLGRAVRRDEDERVGRAEQRGGGAAARACDQQQLERHRLVIVIGRRRISRGAGSGAARSSAIISWIAAFLFMIGFALVADAR